MNKIDEMLKNEKVEWKRLDSLIEYEQPTDYIVKTTNYNDKYNTPVLTAGQTFILGFTDEKQGIYNANKENPVIIFDDFTSSNQWVDFNFKVKSSAMKILKPREGVNLRYCYHYMQIIKIDTTEHKRLWISKYSQIEIPIPSLQTQEKIVKILDTFTELQTELQTRIKQYSYYRDTLLSEKYLNKISEKIDKLENQRNIYWCSIKEICRRQKGINITAEKMKKINKLGASIKIFAGGNTVAYVNEKDIDKEKIINQPSIIVKSRGNIDFEFYDGPFSHKNEMWSYATLDKKLLNIKYLYYYLKSNVKYFKDNAISGKLPQISTSITDNYKVPVPDILIQNKVVQILDKFQSLVEDTKGLLPQEIEQRKKQYEYYREKLLTFFVKCDNCDSRQQTADSRQLISNDYFVLLKEAADIVGIKLFDVERKKLGEISIGKLEYGSGASAIEFDGKVRYIRITDIDELGNLKENKVSPSIIEGDCYLQHGDILFARSGATVGKNFIYQEDELAIFAGYLIRLRTNKDIANSKYVYHCVKTNNYEDFVNYNKSSAAQPNINAKQYSEFSIPLPSLSVQEYIVSILDKFDTMTNDLSQGLPKEIELRKKQYEYYREKLLNFQR